MNRLFLRPSARDARGGAGWRAASARWPGLSRLLVLAVLLLATGCVHRQGEAGLAATLNSSSAEAAQRAAAVGVAVGDRIRVKVWREADLNDSLTVDATGQIVLPRVGPLRVAGLSIGRLQDSLRTLYAVYVKDPVVTVTVYRRVGLQGEVRSPGLYYVDPTVTLRDVITQGGGLTEAADPSDVEVVREGRRIMLDDAANGVPLASDLRSGDAIVVGRRSWLSRNSLAVVSTLGLVVSVAVQVFRK